MGSNTGFRGFVSRGFTLRDLLVAVGIVTVIGIIVWIAKSNPGPDFTLHSSSGQRYEVRFNDILIISGARPGVFKPVRDLPSGNYLVLQPLASQTNKHTFGLQNIRHNELSVWFSHHDQDAFSEDYLISVVRNGTPEYEIVRNRTSGELEQRRDKPTLHHPSASEG